MVLFPRGGDDGGGGDSVVAEEPDAATAQEQSLDDRVNAAMRRLGLGDDDPTTEPSAVGVSSPDPSPPPPPHGAESDANSEEGARAPEQSDDDDATPGAADAPEIAAAPQPTTEEGFHLLAERISEEMSVPRAVATAAVFSSLSATEDDTRVDEDAARSMVQSELDAMAGVPEDCPEAVELVGEGFDAFLVRRSLAFAQMDVNVARAILAADREDEEAELREAEEAAREEAALREEPEMKTVTVDYPEGFDPLAGAAASTAPPPAQQQAKPEGAPTPAKKEDVIFEGTTEDLQRLVVESPVPVLLDVYADWCGPCKQLTPALEQICINAGGMLRLVKINTDQQRQISGALEVKSLPTIFGIRDGKILNSFQGLPRDEKTVRDFLMGTMVPGQSFNPPVSEEDEERYRDLSGKMLKLAAGASFSFSARERLENHVAKLLDELVSNVGGETGMAVADDSARVLRSLMANVITNPFEEKFRKIKLDNKVIAAKVARHPPCMAILKSIGFAQEGETTMVVAKGKKVVNIAPFVVGRGCIDKWIDKNRHQIAAAGRKRRDEINRARLAAEAEEEAKNRADESEEEESEEEEDSTSCLIKLRLEGKKKVHEIEMDAEDTLGALADRLPFPVEDGETVQFTCVSKRLIIKSTDTDKMAKTLTQLRLAPAASVVVKIGTGKKAEVARGSLAERAASKKKTTGSHSMHSIGLYAKDDGNKAETFESGGVLYDHVLTDDEEEDGEEEEKEEEADESEQDTEGSEETSGEDEQ